MSVGNHANNLAQMTKAQLVERQAELERDIIKLRHSEAQIKRQEAELRQRKEWLNLALGTGRIGMWSWEIQENTRNWDEATYEIFGLNPEHVGISHENFLAAVHPEDREDVKKQFKRAVEDGKKTDFEYRVIWSDGTIRHLESRTRLLRDDRQNPSQLIGMVTDVTERKQAEHANQRLAAIVETSADAIIATTTDGTITDWNKAANDMYGYSAEEAIGRPVSIIVPPDLLHEFQENFKLTALKDHQTHLDRVRQRKDGKLIDINLTVSPFKDVTGNIVGYSTVNREISDQKRAVKALRESEERFNAFFAGSPAGLAIWDDQIRFVKVNEPMAQINGYPVEEHFGKTLDEVIPTLAPELVSRFRKILETGVPSFTQVDGMAPSEPNVMNHWLSSIFPILGSGGLPMGLGGVVIDITEQIQLQEALRESEERFSLVIAGTNEGIWDWNIGSDENYFSPRWKEIVGYREDELAHHRDSLIKLLHPDDQNRVFEMVRMHLEKRTPFDLEYRLRHKSGEYIWVRGKGQAMWDENGEPLRMAGSISDITKQRHLEDQLREFQKMEAVGQLTGGIAHEFNNLLMVISGNLELLQEKLPNDDPLHRFTATAIASVLRGAELTTNLLSFSRKQSLQVASVEMNELTLRNQGMLQRMLGETINIELDLTENLWRTLADAGQIENALLNLAINARDAMPGGGRIVMRTSNRIVDDDMLSTDLDINPGDYVALEVIDTGSGMPPEVIEHAFEPFYTTKDVGKGTGLGLSMVYGFAKQSGGFAEIESELGRGTTVRLCLPRAEQQDGDDAEEVLEAQISTDGNGTILVVEDDPAVLALVVNLINDLGYQTIEAEDGTAALARLEELPNIDLLFTDIVLPHGLSGVDIARDACRRRPDLKVVLTSGYPEKEIGDLTIEGEKPLILRKPYLRSELAELLDSVMENKARHTCLR